MPTGVLHPVLLSIGVLCASIPILVHLLRRRYQPVSWGAMRFLEHALKKRRRRLTLEQLLLLALRVALVLMIAIGVGSLLFASDADDEPETLIIVLDNSIHAQRLNDASEPVFADIISSAEALIDSLDASRGDQAALLTLGSPAAPDASPATGQLELIRRTLTRVRVTDASRDTEGAAAFLRSLTNTPETEPRTRVVVLTSDTGWERGTIEPIVNSGAPTRIITHGTQTNVNVAITGLSSIRALLTPEDDDRHGVVVTLERDTQDAPSQTRVRIEQDQGSQLGERVHTWDPAQRTASVVVPITTPERPIDAGTPSVALTALIDDDSNASDNTRHTPIAARRELRVAIIERGSGDTQGVRASRWVRAVLRSSGSLVEWTMIEAGAAAERLDPSLDAVFVLDPSAINENAWTRITSLRDRGALVVITPDPDPTTEPIWISGAEPLVSDVLDPERVRVLDDDTKLAPSPPDHPMLSGIRDEFASLASSVRLTRRLQIINARDESTLVRTQNGDPLVLSSDDERVVVFALAFDDRWSDLPARPLFVAMMQELLRRGVGAASLPETIIAGTEIGSRIRTIERRTESVRSTITSIVNPDARLSAAASSAPQTQGDTLRISDASDLFASDSDSVARASTTLGVWPFLAALLIAIGEFLLARRCSLRIRPIPEVRS